VCANSQTDSSPITGKYPSKVYGVRYVENVQHHVNKNKLNGFIRQNRMYITNSQNVTKYNGIAACLFLPRQRYDTLMLKAFEKMLLTL
jgi:hypothetical protein